jgi:hypothetical protein
MRTETKLIKTKLGLINLAEHLGNVSQACRMMGYSRDSFYRLEAKVAQEGIILTEAQMIAMERKREKREAFGEIETEHPGYLGAQDTYYVGNIKGVGRINQQTFIDTYSKVAFAKLYDRKTAITAADMVNDKVVPFFEEQQIPLLRILTDRGTEYCGKAEYHEYELYLRIENIEHSKTKVKSPHVSFPKKRIIQN